MTAALSVAVKVKIAMVTVVLLAGIVNPEIVGAVVSSAPANAATDTSRLLTVAVLEAGVKM